MHFKVTIEKLVSTDKVSIVTAGNGNKCVQNCRLKFTQVFTTDHCSVTQLEPNAAFIECVSESKVQFP